MSRRKPRSEVIQLVAPIASVLDAVWRRVHWWILLMTVLYAASGVTIVHPGEVAVVMRWGHVVGAPIEPGIAFLMPYPFEQVVRVPVKRVFEQRIRTLADDPIPRNVTSLDPTQQGYALTGDQNIVHVEVVARYQIRDPIAWAFLGPREDDVVRTEVTAAMMRSLGEIRVERVLSDGRKDLIATASRRAQAGLDAAGAGLELSSLELTHLGPPVALTGEFDAVQSAAIGATTAVKNAQNFRARAIPEAQISADRAVQSARARAASDAATAEGDAEAFLELDASYRENPAVVRERLYRDGVENAIGSGGEIRWVPPPVGARYDNFRISVTTNGAGPLSEEPPTPSRPTRTKTPNNNAGDTDEQ